MDLNERIAFAKGERPVDIRFINGQVIDVFAHKVVRRDVAVANGLIVGFGDYPAQITVDLNGMFLSPGFIDAHVHIESSFLEPARYAQAVIPHGVTGVVTDFHEIANVMGIEGVRLMHRWANNGPVDVYVMAPSCVPATSLETSGADLSDDDLRMFMGEPWVLGMGELMNFPGVVNRSPDVLNRIHMAQGLRVDGHAPALTGRELSAYVIAGIGSDHECTDQAEAEEKLSRGMYLMIREGSSARKPGSASSAGDPR